MNAKITFRDCIDINPEIMGGRIVFKGTRVPIETLFDHLAAGFSYLQFVEEFPSVDKAHAAVVTNSACSVFITYLTVFKSIL